MTCSCELVRDLLPLYHDGVCSIDSRHVVEAHLAECPGCAAMRRRLAEKTYDDTLTRERAEVVGRYAKRVRRKSLTAGLVLGAVLTAPILVCLICNLAVGHGLDWFFIVLASLLVFSSVTVVPLVAEARRLLWTLACFSASLTLLLLVCCLYTCGSWFLAAAVPVLFGLSVLFLPAALRQAPLKGVWAKSKGLICMTVNTALLYAVLAVCAPYSSDPDYWPVALSVSAVFLGTAWAMFLFVRYARCHGLTKAGFCVLLAGSFVAFCDAVFTVLMYGVWENPFAGADFRVWNYDAVNANTRLIIFLAGLVCGGLLAAWGCAARRRKNKK